MASSEERAVLAVERAIRACEGLLMVDGRRYPDILSASIACHALAERAVADAHILRRYIRIEPPCPWCGADIKPLHESREVEGRVFHDMPELRCADAFSDNIDAYELELSTESGDAHGA